MMFATSGMVTPICLPEISRELSTGFSEGGGLEMARNFVVLIVLLAAGMCASKLGKKGFLTSGQYLLAFGLLMTSYAESYTSLIVSLMIAGIGGGFVEALINPLVMDIHPRNPGKFLNITNAFYPLGVMASALIFGELLTQGYDWRLMFRIAASGALAVGIFFHLLHFPPAAHQIEHSSVKEVIRIMAVPQFWVFAAAIFLGAGVESAFTFWSRTYVETYLQDLPRAGAIGVVIFAGSMALGRFLAARISQLISLKTLMISSAILGVVTSVGILFSTSLTGFYLLLILAGLAAACFWPTVLAEASNRMRVDATLLFVLLACFGIAGFGFTPWMMGLIGDSAGLKSSFWVIPAFFVGLIVVLTLNLDRNSRPTK